MAELPHESSHERKMESPVRVAMIYYTPSEYYLPEDVKRYGNSDDFDREIIATNNDHPHRTMRGLKRHGVEGAIYYLTTRPVGVLEHRHAWGHKLIRIPALLKWKREAYLLAPALVKELKKRRDQWDIIHIQGYYNHWLLPDQFDLFMWQIRNLNWPVVAHYRTNKLPSIDSGSAVRKALAVIKRRIKVSSLKRANRLLSNNHVEIGRWSDPKHPEYYGIDYPFAKPFEHIPNLVSIEHFKIIDKNEARKKMGLPLQGRYIGFAGRLSRMKGLLYLFQAVKQLEKKYDDLTVLIAGRGIDEPLIRKQAEEEGLGERVEFIGFLQQEKLNSFMAASDVHVLPSLADSETFGAVHVEAIASGTPTIGTDKGGQPEVLADGRGLIVPPADSNALAAALMEVFEGRYSWSKEIYDQVAVLYSEGEVTKRLKKLYLEVLDDHRLR